MVADCGLFGIYCHMMTLDIGTQEGEDATHYV